MFITSGNWRGKHNLLSRGAGADQRLKCGHVCVHADMFVQRYIAL